MRTCPLPLQRLQEERCVPGSDPRTTASAALHPGGHVDIDRIAGHSLLQRQGQLIPQVGPAKNLGTPATARVAEDIPENVSEYVAERF